MSIYVLHDAKVLQQVKPYPMLHVKVEKQDFEFLKESVNFGVSVLKNNRVNVWVAADCEIVPLDSEQDLLHGSQQLYGILSDLAMLSGAYCKLTVTPHTERNARGIVYQGIIVNKIRIEDMDVVQENFDKKNGT